MEYLVSFSPAELKPDGRALIMVTRNIGQTITIDAANLDERDRKVVETGSALGQPCSPYVRLKDRNARSPAGFKKRFQTPFPRIIGGGQ